MAAITVWMAIWWLAEPVHLAVTALIPVMFIPLFGIADVQATANQYMDQVMFLFIGGFLLAFAIQRWDLHKRIALKILSKVGSSLPAILSGIMLTAWFMSMWISNTATVMMLLGAVTAVVLRIEQDIAKPEVVKRASAVLFIALAFSATIGGMATLVGTPPNMVFYKMYLSAYPEQNNMNFTTWFAFAFPVSLALLIVAWGVLRYVMVRKTGHIKFDRAEFRSALKELGPAHRDEKNIAIVFGLTVLLWFTRSGFDIGGIHIPGWSVLFGSTAGYIQDSSVAVVMAFVLFLIPSSTEPGRSLLSWDEARKLPFDIILLFGSGFALAYGFEQSGLSNWLAHQLHGLQGYPLWLIILIVCAVVTIISEFASNVASIQLALPILISLQKVLNVDPLVLMIPATLAASLGFMLPVATAPNTIVFGTGRIRVRDMMQAGFVLDLAGIGLILLFAVIFLLK